MGGKPRRRKAPAKKAGRVAETPGSYGSASPDESAAARDAAVKLFPSASLLSLQERAAIGWMLLGKTNADIAEITHKSKRTIELQMASGLHKLGVDDRESALALHHHLEVTQLNQQNIRLEEELDAAATLNTALRQENTRQKAVIEAQEAQIKTLRRQIQRQS